MRVRRRRWRPRLSSSCLRAIARTLRHSTCATKPTTALGPRVRDGSQPRLRSSWCVLSKVSTDDARGSTTVYFRRAIQLHEPNRAAIYRLLDGLSDAFVGKARSGHVGDGARHGCHAEVLPGDNLLGRDSVGVMANARRTAPRAGSSDVPARRRPCSTGPPDRRPARRAGSRAPGAGGR